MGNVWPYPENTQNYPHMPADKSKRDGRFSRWLDFHSESRATLLPLDRDFALPLRELGVALAGVDQLVGHFRAGTPASATHLAWFVTRGKIQCEWDAQVCPVQAGELLLCEVGKPHYLKLKSKQATGIWFHLRDLPHWEHLRGQHGTVRRSNSISTLALQVDQFLAESNSPSPQAKTMAQHYGHLIALILQRELAPYWDSHQINWIQRLSQLWKTVEHNPAYPWTTEELAQRTCVSPSYLYKITERYYGTSPMKMVLRLRMGQATALLTHTNVPIESIATDIGYQTAYAFSNAFMRFQGIRPGAYRKKTISGLT